MCYADNQKEPAIGQDANWWSVCRGGFDCGIDLWCDSPFSSSLSWTKSRTSSNRMITTKILSRTLV